jgi:hypothetical protein
MNAEHAANQRQEQEHPAMNEQAISDAKVQKPSTYFVEPQEVVVDSSLSKSQKVETLDALEQDARQLAEASSEGMGGGKRNKLQEVLIAKDALALQSVADNADETVVGPAITAKAPSFTPVTRSGNLHQATKVVTIGHLKVILVEEGHGEGLRVHLASHGIAATVHPGEEGPLERVQLAGDVNAKDVQAIIDEWEH